MWIGARDHQDRAALNIRKPLLDDIDIVEPRQRANLRQVGGEDRLRLEGDDPALRHRPRQARQIAALVGAHVERDVRLAQARHERLYLVALVAPARLHTPVQESPVPHLFTASYAARPTRPMPHDSDHIRDAIVPRHANSSRRRTCNPRRTLAKWRKSCSGRAI